MKALLRKIRQILKDRRTRRFLTRFVSGIAAVVVFVTTYALVLPAITMESQAACGIEAHQHDDSCYSEKLICGQEESEGHHHTDDCYTVTRELECQIQEHRHSSENGCFDEGGNLVCKLEEHTHTDSCYKEHRELACGMEESEGHHHTDSCYEKVLTCGKEVHTHSAACYKADPEVESAAVASTGMTSAAAVPDLSGRDYYSQEPEDPEEDALVSKSLDKAEQTNAMEDTDEDADDKISPEDNSEDETEAEPDGDMEDGKADRDGIKAGSGDADKAGEKDKGKDKSDSKEGEEDASSFSTSFAADEDAENGVAYIPDKDALDFSTVLNRKTGIYYHHVAEDEEIEDSSSITEWNKADEDTELNPGDIIRVYLSYTLPKDTINATNDISRYRLPDTLHLTDDQIGAINSCENGISAQYIDYDSLEITDPERHAAYLGLESVEGRRLPGEELKEDSQEYISAVVRAEKIYDEDTGEYEGTDLIFTFSPYAVEKNAHEYDKKGQPTRAGEEVTGWLTLDFNMGQIDWTEDKTSEIVFAEEDEENDISEISTVLRQADPADDETGEIAEDGATEAAAEYATEEAVAAATTAEIAAEDSTEAAAAETAAAAATSSEKAVESSSAKADADDKKDFEKEKDHKDDTEEESVAAGYPAAVFDDSITVRSGRLDTDLADTDMPKKTKMTVHVEADEGTFPEGTKMVLSAVEDLDAVAEAVGTAVDSKTRGFQAVDITFYDKDPSAEDAKEIEPLKPIRVSIKSDEIKKAAEDSSTAPVVVHIEDDNTATAIENTASKTDSGTIEIEKPAANPENTSDPAVQSDDGQENESDKNTDSQENDSPAASIVETEDGSADTDKTADDMSVNEESADKAGTGETVEFEADSFSVYAIVYTVEFHWEINGEELTYTLKGGDALSFAKLAKEFGLADSYIRSYDERFKTSGSESSAASAEGENTAETNDVSRRFIEQVKTVEFSDPDLVWVEKATEDTATWKIMSEHDLHPEYPYGTTEQEFCEMYSRTFTAPDWVLLSLKPFDTTETLTVTMKTGEVITIEVTDAQDAPMIDDGQGGQVVQTINNPNGTTIDLFDYWITNGTRNNQGMDGWPGHTGDAFSSWDFDWYDYDGNRKYPSANPMDQDSDRNNDWYIQNGYLRGNGNSQGINSGHVFKFYPGAAGTVEDYGDKGWHTHGTNNAWTNNHDKYSSINSWTGSADPTTGLVQPYLNGQGYPQLTNDASKGTDGSALNYLFDDNYHAGKQKYEGVNNLLYVNPDGYYTYDSWFYSADLNDDNTNFTVKEHSSGAAQAQRGFWPFGDRVNWHGMHMTTEFSMPANGQVLNPKGEYKDMEFEFHGDDDTWLYIDGILVGDGGGIHNHTKININFKTGLVVVTGTVDPVDDHVGTYTSERYLDDIFRSALAAQGKSQAEINAYIAENFDGHIFKAGSKHTFEMFYLERGGSESNLFIKYNLISTTDFTAHKSYHMLQGDPHARLERDQFKFELIGFDNTDLGTGFEQAIMPANGTPTGDGTYASPKKIYHEATADSEGYTSLITGVTEDGNVNFGNIQVQASQAGMTYRYMVREVVDPDAENADGIAWKDATEEQRAEGGFIDENGVTYDGRVYYFTGTVQETSPGSGKYELKKTRYTDETYSTIDTETKFFSFVNGHVEPITLKVLKKSDSDNHKPLSGAQFSLIRGKHIVEHDNQGNVTSEHWIPRPESTPKSGTTSNGTLTFNNLAEGHYILEETAAPAGYTRNGTSRWLLTLTKEDSADEIVMIPTIRPLDENGNATGPAETLDIDNTHTIEHEVLNTKLPRGPLTVQKKWIKPDGTTEYTTEELNSLEDATGVTVTGELWRRATVDATPPTVSIYSKLNNESDYQLRWQEQVEPDSTVSFSMAVNGTGYPINKQYTTDTGDTVVENGNQDIYYDYISGNQIHKTSGHVFALKNINHDVSIYGVFDSSQASSQNNPRIGFKMISYTSPTGSGQQPLEQQVGTFTLDSNNHWTKTWTSEQLNEDDYDYEYYLKNVSEPSLEGYVFIKDPEVSTEVSTGSVTYAVKNIKEGPMTDLTVRKVWGDGIDHSGETISYKIQRKEFDAEGNEIGGPYDYIEFGKTASEIYTLSNSDVYNGAAWQKHHNKLPATNGKEETDPEFKSYQYSVVEVNPPADYTASYYTLTVSDSGNEYSVSVIKNNPTDARVSVEKKWLDFDGVSNTSAGIPEGTYITGTLKRSYTWQEASGTTVRVYNRLWNQGQILSTTLYKTYSDVQDNSDFSLWAIDSNGNEPLNGVSANGSPVSQTGAKRTFNMGNWSRDTYAYVIHVNGPTDVILDWAYNTGYQNGWHYDVDYSTAAAGSGQTHNETETVGTFRIDASNDWKWVWTDRELDQDHVYTYFFDNVQEHSSDGTVVAHFDGFNEPEIGSLTQGSDGKWTATIKNIEEPGTCSIKVTKQWEAEDHNQDEIQFTLMQRPYTLVNGVKSYQAEASEYTGEYTNTITGNGTVTIDGLPARAMINNSPVYYEYFVNEDTALEGFHVSYILVEGDKEDQDPTNDIDEWKIINSPKSDAEEDTFIEVDKSWVGDPEGTTHENDNITYKVKQEAYSTDYIPVRFVKKDSSGAENSSQTYYVEKNGSFTVHINTKKAGNNRNIISRRYSNSGQQPVLETEETIQYTSQNGLVKTYEDLEGPTIIELQMTEGNIWAATVEKNKWVAYVPGDENPGMYSSLESLVADEATGTPASIASNEFLMTATATERKGESQTFGTINPDVNGWKSKIEDLPLYNYDNGAGYVYKYSVAEIYINTDEVIDNETDFYTVTSSTSGKVTTLVNTAKETMKVQAEKKWFEPGGEPTDEAQEPNASIQFKLIRKTTYTPTGNAPAKDAAEAQYTVGAGADGYFTIRKNPTTKKWTLEVTGLPLTGKEKVIDGENTYIYNAAYSYKIEEMSITKANGSTTDYDLSNYHISYSVTGITSQDGTLLTGNGAITINNERILSVELPESGGPGTGMFTIIGSVLLAFAGILLIRGRRSI